ncbi:MAG: translational GTPase TypA, partial [Leptospirales bacterium]
QHNVALRVEDTGSPDTFKVSGRGILHLSILIENMRREKYEVGVSRPEVILKVEEGQKFEPYEHLVLDLPETASGRIIQELNRRKGLMTQLTQLSDEMSRVEYEIPTRGLIGFRSYFLTETRGEGTFSSIFLDYRPYAGAMEGRKSGALISMENGKTSGYALFNIQERGELFIGPVVDVYAGMVIGLHSRDNDLDVNPVKEKKLTNVRASGTDEALKLVPPLDLSLEESMDMLDIDEILEVTPNSLRIRKKLLDPTARKRKKAS